MSMGSLESGAQPELINSEAIEPVLMSDIMAFFSTEEEMALDDIVDHIMEPISEQSAPRSTMLGSSLDLEEEEKRQRRRDSKRKCVARKKATLANTEKELQQARAERDRLLNEQRELMNHSQALYNLHEYSRDLLESLKGKLYAAGSGIASWSVEIYRKNVLSIENYIMNVTLPDAVLEQIAIRQDVHTIFISRERIFRVFTALLDEYDSTYDEVQRSLILEKLTRLGRFRDRLMNMLAQRRPELIASFFHANILPAGKDTDRYPGINPKLYPALDSITLTPKQRSQLASMRQSYHEQMASVRKEVRRAQEAIPNIVEDGWHSDPHKSRTLHSAANSYVSTVDAAAVLDSHARQEVLPMLHLLMSIHRILNTHQESKVLALAHPYVADPLQIADLLLGAPALIHGQGGGSGVGTDSCHLIAPASA